MLGILSINRGKRLSLELEGLLFLSLLSLLSVKSPFCLLDSLYSFITAMILTILTFLTFAALFLAFIMYCAVKCAIDMEEILFIFFYHLSYGSLRLIILRQMFTPADTATERERALLCIAAGPRVRHVKWAVLAHTVSDRFSTFVVAAIAEPHGAMAAKESNRAAIHALPVNELGAVSVVADVRADTRHLHQAGATIQVLTPCRIFHL